MADYKGKLTGQQIDELPDLVQALRDDVDLLLDEKFPLTIAATANNATAEVGTSIIPRITLTITKKGVDVTADSTIKVTTPSSGTTVGSDNKSITGTATSEGSYTIAFSATYNSETKTASKVWSWTNYRYLGELSTEPEDDDAVLTLLKECNSGSGSLKKELSTTSTLASTTLPANKYYLFAVKGEVTLVCRHAATSGIVSATTGTLTVPQANDSTKTNTYSYIIVPASASTWDFKIANS